MSTKNLPGGKGRSERKTDNLTAMWGADCLEMGLRGLLQGKRKLGEIMRRQKSTDTTTVEIRRCGNGYWNYLDHDKTP
jgi:hypothetical protein